MMLDSRWDDISEGQQPPRSAGNSGAVCSQPPVKSDSIIPTGPEESRPRFDNVHVKRERSSIGSAANPLSPVEVIDLVDDDEDSDDDDDDADDVLKNCREFVDDPDYVDDD